MIWYHFLYGISLSFALFRSLKFLRILPFWSLTIALGLYAAIFGASPLLVLAIGLSRVLMGVEGYVKLTLAKAWEHGARLLVASWLIAAAAALEVRFFLGPRDWDIFAVRRYISLWDGLWILFALLFFATWGEIRGRSWRHVLFVFGLVTIEAAGALAKLAKVDDAAFWWCDRLIYEGASLLLVGWGFTVPQALQGVGSYRPTEALSGRADLIARESTPGHIHLRQHP